MRLVCWFVALLFVIALRGFASDDVPRGSLEGHLTILPFHDAELADQGTSKMGGNYAGYPLVILSQDGKKEIARVRADANGNYRATLPPGDYILDVERRRPKGHIRAKPQPFKVVSSQTVRVDMDVDTGVR